MATIPNIYRERVQPQPSMDVASRDPGILARGMQQFGRGALSLGADLAQEQNRIENARADSAVNRLRQKQLELSVGEKGYASLKGEAWVSPPSVGKGPLDGYRESFTASKETIAKEMGLSGRALEAYDLAASRVDTDFQAGLLRHALTESDGYFKQTFESTVKAEAQAAGIDWKNPVAIVESQRRVSEATLREAERRGLDAGTTSQLQQEALAGVHSSVIDGALAEGDAKSAEGYFKEYKETLPAATALTLNNKIQAVRKQQIATETADAVMRQVQHRVMPSEYDRARGLASGAAFDGAKVTFGDILKKQGGDIEKAWAAHQIGQKALAEAEKKADQSVQENAKDPAKPVKNWQEFLPKETRSYLAESSKIFTAGGGVTAPTLAEVKELAKRHALASNPSASAEQIDYAMTKAEQSFNDLRTARSQVQDNALLDIQQRIDAGEIRSRHDLTPQDVALLGGKLHTASSYINGALANEDKMAQASPVVRETVDRMKSSPALLAGMDVSAIMSLGPEIGNANVNDLLKRRDDYVNDPEKMTAAKIDADTFEVAIAPYIKGVSKGEAALFKHRVRAKVEGEIASRRAMGASGLTIQKSVSSTIAKYAMTYPIEKPGMLWGTNTEQVPGTEIADIERVPLAPEEVTKIRAKAAKLGLTNLSNDDILRVYRMTKAAEAAK